MRLNISNVYSLLDSDAPDEEHRGAFISVDSTLLHLGQVLGPILMAAAGSLLGLSGAYFADGLAVVMFLAAFFLIR